MPEEKWRLPDEIKFVMSLSKMLLQQRKRPGWEYILVAVLVASSMVLGLGITMRRDRVYKEQLLILELESHRKKTILQMLEDRAIPKNPPWGELPSTLSQDPFGKPYHYDSKTGEVKPTSKKYKHW